MILLDKIKTKIKNLLYTKHPVAAYNLLAATYDKQKGNLLMELDEQLLDKMLSRADLKGKSVVDLGCGTGRHWNKLFDHGVQKVIGVDSSKKMLEVLLGKFPTAETHLAIGSKMKEVKDLSADTIVSNLTIGYIKDIETAFREWHRILKKGGEIIITEYHPAVLQMGGGRTFKHNNKTIAVVNFVHTLGKVRALAAQMNWKETGFSEKSIDESLRDYYADQNALTTYEKFKGTKLIYGLHFTKA